MNGIGANAVLTAFILFCRIGGCLMLMPGFSSPRVPMVVRLFLCFAITLALVPFLGGRDREVRRRRLRAFSFTAHHFGIAHRRPHWAHGANFLRRAGDARDGGRHADRSYQRAGRSDGRSRTVALNNRVSDLPGHDIAFRDRSASRSHTRYRGVLSHLASRIGIRPAIRAYPGRGHVIESLLSSGCESPAPSFCSVSSSILRSGSPTS